MTTFIMPQCLTEDILHAIRQFRECVIAMDASTTMKFLDSELKS